MRKYPALAPARFVLANLTVSLILTIVFTLSASAQNACPSGGNAFSAPTGLRVDIPDGSTGKLMVSWDSVSGANYYNVCRSLDNTTWNLVNYCSGKNPLYKSATSGAAMICRDDNVGSLPAPPVGDLTPYTTYYYQVQACSSGSGLCGAFTSVNGVNQNFNTPISCNCSMTSMQDLKPIKAIGVATSKVITPAMDKYPFPSSPNDPQDPDQEFGYFNAAAPDKQTLVVHLPGSGGSCGGVGDFLQVAQNLGFDVLCINYDNHAEQENICNNVALGGDPNFNSAVCFDNISQAKLDYTAGPTANCTVSGAPGCGTDVSGDKYSGKTTPYYYVASQWDSVRYRITSMLYYLWCTTDNGGGNYDTPTTKWESYLALGQGATCANTNPATALPNWPKIVMSGWSQGGNMSTFAAYENPVQRVVNLSAPLAGTNVGTKKNGYTMVTGCYFWGFNTDPKRSIFPSECSSYVHSSVTPIRQIYGLASSNDNNVGGNQTIHYTPPGANPEGVLQTVWNAMGYNYAPNEDAELDLNCNVNSSDPDSAFCFASQPQDLKTLDCSGNGSHNLTSHGLINKANNGHADTIFFWNEDSWEFMLTQ